MADNRFRNGKTLISDFIYFLFLVVERTVQHVLRDGRSDFMQLLSQNSYQYVNNHANWFREVFEQGETDIYDRVYNYNWSHFRGVLEDM